VPGVVGEPSSESSPYSSAKDFCRLNLLLRAPAVGVETCVQGNLMLQFGFGSATVLDRVFGRATARYQNLVCCGFVASDAALA